jgi:ribose transport system permease protein
MKARPQTDWQHRLSILAGNYGVVVFFLILVAAFALALPDQFPTWANTRTILSNQAIPGLLALAVIIPLVAGEFDLSVGATLGFSSVVSAYLASHGTPVVVVLLVALGVGVAVGIVNGFLVTVVGVGAFIATLGIGTVLAGGNLLVTQGSVISQNIPAGLTDISQTEVLGLPIVCFYVLAMALLLYYLLEWTPFGRYMQATGQGRDAARLTGVRTKRWLFLSFVVAGLIAGLAGFLQTARIGSAAPTVGPEFLLPAYAAAFLGATTIHPGRFNVWGTIIGVLVLAVGISGLTLAGAPFWVPSVFNGGALVVAVSAATLMSRRTVAHAS